MIRCDGGEYRLIERPIDPPLEPHLPPLQRTLLQAIDFANPFMTEEKPASVLVGRILVGLVRSNATNWGRLVCWSTEPAPASEVVPCAAESLVP